MPRLRLLFFAASFVACREKNPSLDNLSCAGSACASGYGCDATSNLCIKTPIIDCGTTGDLCATTAQTGGACPLAGFQLPCTALQSDCSSGNCRICQNDHTWSACPGFGSSTGGGSSSGGTSGGSAPVGAALSIVSGSGQGLGANASTRAISIGQVLGAQQQDSSAQVTFGFSAVVQP